MKGSGSFQSGSPIPTLKGMIPSGSGLGSGEGYLDGQLIVAMPGMLDDRFSRAVIYLCAHSADGAMGIVINQLAPNIRFPELLVQLDIIPDEQSIRLQAKAEHISVLRGGPVETGRGFVLHTADFFIENSTLPIDESVSLTATLDILKAIATGGGPAAAMLALGYAGWAPGQLETEIQANGWLNCPADAELLFDTPTDAKYDKCLRKLGIDPSMLSTESGHA